MYTFKIFKTFLSAVLILFPVFVFSQANYKAGFIVTSKGDTIPGFIDLREWEQTPQSISFKKEKDLKSKPLGIEELSAFSVTDISTFEKYTVNVSLGTVKLEDLPAEKDTTSETRTIFLELIEKGKNASLYKYTDKVKDRFYIWETKPDAKPKELQYSPYLENGSIHEGKTYANQLYLLAIQNGVDSPKLFAKVESLKYEESEIIGVIRMINGNQDNSKTRRKNLKPRFFAGVFLSRSPLVYKGNHDLANEGATHKSETLPGVSFGFDAFKNKEVQKVSLRIEGAALLQNAVTTYVTNYFNSPTPYRTTSHELVGISLVFNPQITYNFYNRPQFKTFLSGGITTTYSRYSRNRYTDVYNTITTHRDIYLRHINISYSARAGIQLKKKIELYVKYLPSMKLDSYMDYSIFSLQSSLGLTYLFK